MAGHSSASYQRLWRSRNPEAVREQTRAARAANPEASRARDILNHAIRTGRIVRPERCELCGKAPGHDARGRSLIQGHHPDYSKPLEVLWVCKADHAALHLGMAA